MSPSLDTTNTETAWLGRTVNDKYRIIAQLGKGGGGTIFVAQQLSQGSALGEVVLKFLDASLSSDPAACRRFIIEAQAARQVQSPYVVKVFDADTDKRGRPFIVMEYLEGQQLAQWTGGEALPPSRVFPLALQLVQALAACHRAGVLHRDLSARNILVLDDELGATVKVVDFGLALVDHAATSETISGTPRYMAPEQIRGEPLDAGVDIFALGVVLYECLAGQAPIEADAPRDYLRRNLMEPARPLRTLQPELPKTLDGLLACMMAKARGERPSDMRDVLARLQSIGKANGWIIADVDDDSVAAASTITCTSAKLPASQEPPAGVKQTPSRGAPLAAAVLFTGLVVGFVYWWGRALPAEEGERRPSATQPTEAKAVAAKRPPASRPASTAMSRSVLAAQKSAANPTSATSLKTPAHKPPSDRSRRREARPKKASRGEPRTGPVMLPSEAASKRDEGYGEAKGGL